jgi:hypothetical protein
MTDDEHDFETNIFYEQTPAEAAIDRLYSLGYGKGDIGVMMDDKTHERALASYTLAKGSEGVATGATIGGALGALIAGIAATGSIAVIAGTGGAAAPFVVGPLAAALAGLGVGATSGGIIGGLIGLRVGETRAKEYEQGIREGGIVIAVRPKSKEHRDNVRRALGNDRLTTMGVIDRSHDHVGAARDGSFKW